jgi:hypothetical protein
MANQVIVTNTGNVQVALTPPANVQVQISRAAIGTVSNVPTANFANYAANVTASNQPNITNVGTLGNLNVSNTITTKDLVVTGNFQVGNLVANSANYANFAGVVTTNAQPNITSVGTLSNLAVSGNIETNIVYHNGTGVAIQSNEWAQLQYTNSAVAPASQYDIGTGSWFYVDNAGAVWQSNTTGTVKTVTLGNNGNINADGNVTAPYFIGNGSQLTGIIANNVANANYANFAGQAFNVNAANITGTVANSNYAAYAGQANTANLATYATIANAVAGANVSGEVANANFASYANLATTANSVNVANVVGIGNIATTNYDGNLSNVLYGNGGFYALPTISNVANANYANYAGEAFNVNASNITGTVANANYSAYAGQANTANLATYATTANSVAGSNVSGVVANANYASYAGTAYSVSGSNVSGEVANANYATYAGTAYSVSGSNVSGYVANSNHATVSDSANSVAVANVSGIGNIATTNYDGNSGNVLYGNGGFYALPVISNVANANYANYAGTVITNAQPNITSVGTLGNLSVTGNIQGGNILSSTFQAVNSAGGALKNASGASQLQWGAGGGNNLTVDVNININPANGQVDISPTGNGGHVHIKPTGNNSVEIAPTTAGIINNMIIGNVTPQAANVTTLGASGNITGANANLGNLVIANYFSGDGSLLSNINGANVSNVANANFANYAGNVTVNAQSNITTVGNLLTLNVINATSNSTQFLFNPNGTNVGVSGQNAASYIVNQFTTQPGTSNSQVLNFQFNTARGNSTNPANVSNQDYIGRMAWNSYNGNTYIRNALITVLAPQGGNVAQQGANVAWGAGSFFINTGNPLGNITSNTTSTTQNLLGFTPTGTLQLIPGTYTGNGTIQNSITAQSYGANTDGAGTGGRIVINRARGNRDTVTAVGNNDTAGGLYSFAYNGNGYLGGTSIYSIVDTTYGSIANGQVVPLVLNISVTSSNGAVQTTSFKPDGNVVFPTSKSVTGGYFYGDGSNLTNVTANLANYATNLTNVASGGRLSLNTTGAGAPQFNLNGDGTVNSSAQFNDSQVSWTLNNVDPSTGFSPFRFQTYQNTLSATLPQRYWRARGNTTSPLPVTAGDEIVDMNFAVYGDSGNTYLPVGDLIYLVNSNDGAGNVTVNASLRGPATTGIGSTFTLGFQNTIANNISGSGNISGANVSINTNGFMKLASYTASALTAITGQIGWMAAVTNSTPGGGIAYWDTTNARWSYVSDNSAV